MLVKVGHPPGEEERKRLPRCSDTQQGSKRGRRVSGGVGHPSRQRNGGKVGQEDRTPIRGETDVWVGRTPIGGREGADDCLGCRTAITGDDNHGGGGDGGGDDRGANLIIFSMQSPD